VGPATRLTRPSTGPFHRPAWSAENGALDCSVRIAARSAAKRSSRRRDLVWSGARAAQCTNCLALPPAPSRADPRPLRRRSGEVPCHEVTLSTVVGEAVAVSGSGWRLPRTRKRRRRDQSPEGALYEFRIGASERRLEGAGPSNAGVALHRAGGKGSCEAWFTKHCLASAATAVAIQPVHTARGSLRALQTCPLPPGSFGAPSDSR